MGRGYYLAYRPPEENSERQRLVQGLADAGAVRLHYSLWRIPTGNARSVLQLVQGRRAILFERSREIVAPSLTADGGGGDIGTVALIAYRLPLRLSRKRAALSRALNRVPALKIGRCLYMVPYLKASKVAAYRGIVSTSHDVFELLEKEGIQVARLTHLRVVYPTNQQPIIMALIEAQKGKIERLVLACHRLREVAKAEGSDDSSRLRKLVSAYRQRYRSLNGVVVFLQRELGVDLHPIIRKAYVALVSCRVLTESLAQA